MDVNQFREYIIRPTLRYLDLWSEAAEELVLGTALQESDGLRYIRQLGNGPALGIIQMEPVTYRDIWTNYIANRSTLHERLCDIAGYGTIAPPPNELLIYNLRFAVGMCRVHYLRVKEALPVAGDIVKQSEYWKKHYNTVLGKGTPTEYLKHWGTYVR